MPPEILGPFGLLIALGVAVGVLWRDHLRADTDDRKDAAEWKLLAQESQRDTARLTRVVEKALKVKVPPAP